MILFFFFQAEDGIRDGRVTGVQTCALPICARLRGCPALRRDGRIAPAVRLVRRSDTRVRAPPRTAAGRTGQRAQCHGVRSEERRVGKECRARWWAEYEDREE